jgi:hypothetical protein
MVKSLTTTPLRKHERARLSVGLNHGDGDAAPSPAGDRRDVFRDPLAADDRGRVGRDSSVMS